MFNSFDTRSSSSSSLLLLFLLDQRQNQAFDLMAFFISILSRLPSMPRKATFYISLFLLLTYLRLLIYYSHEYYIRKLDLEATNKLIETLRKFGITKLLEVERDWCSTCGPYWLNQVFFRGSTSLIGVITSSLFFLNPLRGSRSSPKAFRRWLLKIVTMWQIQAAWDWFEKDTGRATGNVKLNYQVSLFQQTKKKEKTQRDEGMSNILRLKVTDSKLYSSFQGGNVPQIWALIFVLHFLFLACQYW